MTDNPEIFMKEALVEARLAFEKDEVPIGAVVVHQNSVIARAHNLVESQKDSSAHAELLALREASKTIGDWRLNECDLYVTLEPCPMCIGACILSRIKTLYFGAYDERLGAVGSQFNLAQHSGLPHQIEVFPELLAQESKELLQEFFAKKR